MDIAARLTALEDALRASGKLRGLTAAKLEASDYAPGGKSAYRSSSKPKSGGSGRKVASKAGEKRYGLPIGTPLGQGRSKAEKSAHARLMSGQNPADLRRNASRMGNKELSEAAKALFSFASKNERDEAARIALVRELADRGIDPHKLGYKGGPVVLNPKPKPDPVAKAAQDALDKTRKAVEKQTRDRQRAADKAKSTAERVKSKAESDARRAKSDADRTERETTRKAAEAADLRFRNQAANALIEGTMMNKELQERWRNRRSG